MVETCKKVQLSYLLSLDTVQLVDEVLVSVTSTPQCDNKEQNDIVAMDEEATTEEEQPLPPLPHDIPQTDQNDLPADTQTTDEETTENSSNEDAAEPIENAPANELIRIIVEPIKEPNSESTGSAQEATNDADIADGNDEIASQTNVSETEVMQTENDGGEKVQENPKSPKQDTMEPEKVTEADDEKADDHENVIEKDATEVPQTPSPIAFEPDTKTKENDSSMDTDEDTLYIDTTEGQVDADVSMVEERSENENEQKVDDVETAAEESTNAAIKVDEAERKTPLPVEMSKEPMTPALEVSPIESPPPTPTPTPPPVPEAVSLPNASEEAESASDSVSMDDKPEIAGKCD